jgi:RNA polymerase sigma-70 factor (ECF subfamily)
MDTGRQDELYLCAVREFGPALARLARAYESDASQRLDLLQEIHFAIWRSLAGFAEQCSLRTWVYRVAHNVGISKAARRRKNGLASLEELAEAPADGASPEDDAHLAQALDRLNRLIRALKPPDDQVMLLYLEDMDAQTIGEITGLSARAVATRIHRVKMLLARHFRQGGVP